ncbi:MAG: alpha-amylase [Bacteroides sp.]
MENRTMMQYFEWYLPDDGEFWKRCADEAPALKSAGINMVWLPPAYKGAAGKSSVGYDVYDTYDLGEFNQKGTTATKYGTREEYLEAVRVFQNNGIEVLADIVLNHMMGADETEAVMATEDNPDDREQQIAEAKEIEAWTRFTFPGRNKKYSDMEWNASNFSGTDWDDKKKQTGIYCFEGKQWNRETDGENGNYDYLMGADLDTDNEETVKAVTDWGKWYIDTVGMDGFRLDAVKHISFEFYNKWLKTMQEYMQKKAQDRKDGKGSYESDKACKGFAVGEYWSKETDRLTHYLDVTKNRMSLFDVPLHFAFLKAASSDGNFNFGAIFNNTLVGERPDRAVTFVDNHDTQPGQALESFIPGWFKPAAYALILLRSVGLPCVFYGDYYGIEHDNIPPVKELPLLIKIRELFAYGEETDYFDDSDLVGFTRSGDDEHENSGVAVIITDRSAGVKKMNVGEKFAGCSFVDALGHFKEPVLIDDNGDGMFSVCDGSVSVWISEAADTSLYGIYNNITNGR